MRGFKPGYFRIKNLDTTKLRQQSKKINMQRYMQRVAEGKPLFEADAQITSATAPQCKLRDE